MYKNNIIGKRKKVDCGIILFIIVASFISVFFMPVVSSGFNNNDAVLEAVQYRIKGYTYQRQGNIPKALYNYKKAVECNPYYACAYNDLGVLYEQMGQLKKAEEVYIKAITVDPDYASAYNNLAFLYERKDMLEEAIYYLDRRSQMGSENDQWRTNALAKRDELVAEFNRRKTVKAKKQGPRKLGLFKSAPRQQTPEQVEQAMADDLAKRIAMEKSAEMKKDKKCADYLKRAEQYLQSGKYDAAISQYKKIRATDPDYAGIDNLIVDAQNAKLERRHFINVQAEQECKAKEMARLERQKPRQARLEKEKQREELKLKKEQEYKLKHQAQEQVRLEREKQKEQLRLKREQAKAERQKQLDELREQRELARIERQKQKEEEKLKIEAERAKKKQAEDEARLEKRRKREEERLRRQQELEEEKEQRELALMQVHTQKIEEKKAEPVTKPIAVDLKTERQVEKEHLMIQVRPEAKPEMKPEVKLSEERLRKQQEKEQLKLKKEQQRRLKQQAKEQARLQKEQERKLKEEAKEQVRLQKDQARLERKKQVEPVTKTTAMDLKAQREKQREEERLKKEQEQRLKQQAKKQARLQKEQERNRQDKATLKEVDRHFKRGQNFYLASKYEEACKEFEMALAIDPEHAESARLLRYCQRRTQSGYYRPLTEAVSETAVPAPKKTVTPAPVSIAQPVVAVQERPKESSQDIEARISRELQKEVFSSSAPEAADVGIEKKYNIMGVVAYRSEKNDIGALNEELLKKAKAMGAEEVVQVRYFQHNSFIYGYGTAVKKKK